MQDMVEEKNKEGTDSKSKSMGEVLSSKAAGIPKGISEPRGSDEEKKEARIERKIKKKRWHQILAPKMFNEFIVGETLALNPETLIGKKLKVNLMNITRNAKNQNIDVTLKITQVVDGKAKTELCSYELLPASIKRMVRRGRDRVDQSFLIETTDNKKLNIKTFMLTRSNTTKKRSSALVKNAAALITKTAKSKNYDMFIMDIISHKLQRDIRDNLNKIYPLRTFEIKKVQMISKAEENVKASN